MTRIEEIRARADRGKILVGLGAVPNVVAELIDDIEYLLARIHGQENP